LVLAMAQPVVLLLMGIPLLPFLIEGIYLIMVMRRWRREQLVPEAVE
jgi:hypothetical protein